MRFSLLSLIAAFTIILPAYGQQLKPPVYDWVVTAGGAKSDKTRGVTVDRDGNVFLTGEVTDHTQFGDLEVKSAGGMDGFVAKLDPHGHFLWATTFGGPLTDRGYGVATDAAGNAYVTGHTQLSEGPKVNGVTPKSSGQYDVYLAKYDRDGKLLWQRSAGGKGYNYGHGIAVDSAGEIVVTGGVVGEARFGDVVLANDPGSHVFCAKYNTEGKLLWVKVASGKGSSNGQALSVDATNHIYITGSAGGASKFGSKELASKTEAALVMKLSPSGDPEWVSLTPGSPRCLGSCIAADASGRVWISGIFHGTVTLAGQTFQSLNDDAKNSDGFIAAFDPAGTLKWAQALVGPSVDYCLGVATDGQGYSFVTGEFSETANFADQKMTSQGLTDIFTAALDESGKLQWISQCGGVKGDNAYYIVADGKGALIIGGACMAPAQFGDKKVEVTGGADLYGAKMHYR